MIILLGIFYFTLRTSVAQTWLTRHIVSYVYSSYHVNITIGGVDIELFKKIVLEDVYIGDLQQDTLLHMEKLKIAIGEFSLKKRRLIVDELTLTNATAALVYYKNEPDLNLQFLLDAVASSDTTASDTTGGNWELKVNALKLDNVDFAFRDDNDTTHSYGMKYMDIRTRNVYGEINDIHFSGDSIFFSIHDLAAVEQCGFILKRLSTTGSISSRHMDLQRLQIETPHSKVATHLTFQYATWSDYIDFITRVSFKAEFDKTHLQLADIAYFAPYFEGIDKTIVLSGKISGRVDDFKGKKLDIRFGNASSFSGDISMLGLPDVDATFLHLDIKELRTNNEDLKTIPIPPFTDKQMLETPANFACLGSIGFKGKFSGFFNDFVAYGKFSTGIGSLSSDVSMRIDSATGKAIYHGKIGTTAFDIGKFLSISQLGKITIETQVDGSGLQADKVNAGLEGVVQLIQFNGYDYTNMEVQGQLARKVFKGRLNVKDKNIGLRFVGDVDFNKALPSLDFAADIDSANLTALNFLKTPSYTNLSTKIAVTGVGSNVDNIRGYLKIHDTRYIAGDEHFAFEKVELKTEEEGKQRLIHMESDFADVDAKGTFIIADLIRSIQHSLGFYLPSYVSGTRNSKKLSPETVDVTVKFKKTDNFTRLFLPQLQISSGSKLQGSYHSEQHLFNLAGDGSMLSIAGKTVHHWKMNVTTSGSRMDLQTTCDKLMVGDSIWLGNLAVGAGLKNDTLQLGLDWDNKTNVQNKGNIGAGIVFGKDKHIGITILPSAITISDSLWKTEENSRITIDSSRIAINNVLFKHGEQMIGAHGVISSDKKEQLTLHIGNLNLANINSLTQGSGFSFKGNLDGDVIVADVYDKMLFQSNINFSDVSINKELLGKGTIRALFHPEKDEVEIDGKFTRGIVDNIKFSGSYFPSRKENSLDVQLSLEAFNLSLFQDYVKDYCTNFRGQLSGALKISGVPSKPEFNGTLMARRVGLLFNYLNTKYSFTAEIKVQPNSFGLEEVAIFDTNGNVAIARGKLYHENFSNFQFDFDLEANKFLCLNTTEAQNNLYYGKAFVTGVVNIFGYLDRLTLDANVKSEKGTQIFIPLSGTAEVEEANFITFVKKDTVKTKNKENYKVTLDGMQLNLNLDVTPDAMVQLIFDQKIGDVIKGRGNGSIKMNINTLGNFSMYGDYTVESGDYLFTLKNIINKKFDLEKGGTVKWSGDPYDADINLNAVYKTRTSIHPFFPGDSSGIYKRRFPVECKMLMTGKLLTPDISFDVDLPSIDDKARQDVKSYLKTEQEMNRQVFTLLVLGSFATPYQLQGIAEDPAGNGVASNSSELLSNQLNNMLSNISKDFDIGLNYRPGDLITNKELEVALSTQLFNDKMVIDGNVGVSNNSQQATNTLVGDVNIEYKLSDDGRFRVKAFNRTNDRALFTTATVYTPYTQGVGIFYREEFDTIGELYKRYVNKIKGKKEKKNT